MVWERGSPTLPTAMKPKTVCCFLVMDNSARRTWRMRVALKVPVRYGSAGGRGCNERLGTLVRLSSLRNHPYHWYRSSETLSSCIITCIGVLHRSGVQPVLILTNSHGEYDICIYSDIVMIHDISYQYIIIRDYCYGCKGLRGGAGQKKLE